jgi:hypothetical protein
MPGYIRTDPTVKRGLRRVMMKSQEKEVRSKFFQTRSDDPDSSVNYGKQQ